MTEIVFYTDTDYFSGAEIYFARAILAATKANYRITVIVSPFFKNVTHPLWQEVQKEVSDIRYIATGNKLAIGYVRQLRRLLQSLRPRLVVCNMWSPFANTWLLKTAHALGIKLVAIEHFFQTKADISYPLRPLKLLAYRLKYGWVDHFVAVSEVHRRVLVRDFNFSPEKISVIHGGVAGGAKTQSTGSIRLIFLGTLEARKNPLFLLEVLSGLKDKNWQLSIAGSGEQAPLLEASIARHNLKSRVALLGKVPNGSEALSRADILLHPALSENYSLVIAEAMGRGLVVVANDVGGNSELVESGKSGYLLEVGDIAGWQAALGELLDNPAKLEAMSKTAKIVFERDMTAEVMAGRLIELYGKWAKQ